MPEATTELGDFLRRRRESLPPASVGIKSVTLRRTPGLRRNEVAERANMSLVYYERLEQGRGPHPSASMLGSIAQALELNADERDHLFRLAGYSTPFEPEFGIEPDPQLVAALDALSPHVPAAIVHELGDALVQNRMNIAIFGDLTGPRKRSTNLIWQWFTCAEYRHWQEPPEQHEQTGQAFVADLRAVVARRGKDPRAVMMVDELRSASTDFAAWWDDHTVAALHCNVKRINDERVGLLELECSVMLSQSTTQRLMLLQPRPGTDTDVRLARLLHTLKGLSLIA
ncbi:helix-turn-helix transcriptional regulator [Actinoplanes sp. NPDC051470]|uniref:helix-turn-helix transcriptional regulator n=1 Tax=Actinoplanes sp. NPDC051470 TaxID=3157224 RepID=UPI00341A4841